MFPAKAPCGLGPYLLVFKYLYAVFSLGRWAIPSLAVIGHYVTANDEMTNDEMTLHDEMANGSTATNTFRNSPMA